MTGHIYTQSPQSTLCEGEVAEGEMPLRFTSEEQRGNFTGLAADTLSGAVFFVESSQGVIGVFDNDTDSYRVLYDRQEQEVKDTPHSIAVDPYLGYVS